MSITQTVGHVFTEFQIKTLTAGITGCELDNATRDAANGIMDNMTNWIFGSGLPIIIAVGVFGLFMLIFGKTKWIRVVGMVIIGLVLLEPIIRLIEGVLPNSGCY